MAEISSLTPSLYFFLGGRGKESVGDTDGPNGNTLPSLPWSAEDDPAAAKLNKPSVVANKLILGQRHRDACKYLRQLWHPPHAQVSSALLDWRRDWPALQALQAQHWYLLDLQALQAQHCYLLDLQALQALGQLHALRVQINASMLPPPKKKPHCWVHTLFATSQHV